MGGSIGVSCARHPATLARERFPYASSGGYVSFSTSHGRERSAADTATGTSSSLCFGKAANAVSASVVKGGSPNVPPIWAAGVASLVVVTVCARGYNKVLIPPVRATVAVAVRKGCALTVEASGLVFVSVLAVTAVPVPTGAIGRRNCLSASSVTEVLDARFVIRRTPSMQESPYACGLAMGAGPSSTFTTGISGRATLTSVSPWASMACLVGRYAARTAELG